MFVIAICKICTAVTAKCTDWRRHGGLVTLLDFVNETVTGAGLLFRLQFYGFVMMTLGGMKLKPVEEVRQGKSRRIILY